MHYADKLRVSYFRENKIVSLSIRINENNVWTHQVPLADFQQIIAQLNMALEEAKEMDEFEKQMGVSFK